MAQNAPKKGILPGQDAFFLVMHEWLKDESAIGMVGPFGLRPRLFHFSERRPIYFNRLCLFEQGG